MVGDRRRVLKVLIIRIIKWFDIKYDHANGMSCTVVYGK
jgi:hypothetical protein